MEKVPGTYCPLCGNMGLVKVKHKGEDWAICPIGADGAIVSSPKDAHTGYVLPKAAAAAKKAEPEPEPVVDKMVDESDFESMEDLSDA